jgi:hypothetical protein
MKYEKYTVTNDSHSINQKYLEKLIYKEKEKIETATREFIDPCNNLFSMKDGNCYSYGIL